MTLNSKNLAALVFAILFGGIFFSSAMGWWQTESTKVAAVFTSGEYAGQANPADIRGSYTFGDVEENFRIPAAMLAEAFAVSTTDSSAYQVKSLEEMYASSSEEIGTASVRLFVAFALNLPYDLSTDIYLPQSAAGLLRQRNLTGEQTAYLESHTISNLEDSSGSGTAYTAPQPTQALPAEPTPEVDHTSDENLERLVKGKTTFAELQEWGVSTDAIEELVRAPLPPAPGVKVKDFCTEQGLIFETIKVELQVLVDQAK